MSDYWFNAAKTAGDSSLRAVAQNDPEKIVWVNLSSQEKGHQLAVAERVRSVFGKASVTIDLSDFEIKRGKNGSRSVTTTYHELMGAIMVTPLVVGREMSCEEIDTLNDVFGAPAPRTNVVADDDLFE